MTEIHDLLNEVDPARIQRGRRLTAAYVGVLTVASAACSAVAHETGSKLAMTGTALSLVVGATVGYLYYDGDGDLSPHRSRERHFSAGINTANEQGLTPDAELEVGDVFESSSFYDS